MIDSVAWLYWFLYIIIITMLDGQLPLVPGVPTPVQQPLPQPQPLPTPVLQPVVSLLQSNDLFSSFGAVYLH